MNEDLKRAEDALQLKREIASAMRDAMIGREMDANVHAALWGFAGRLEAAKEKPAPVELPTKDDWVNTGFGFGGDREYALRMNAFARKMAAGELVAHENNKCSEGDWYAAYCAALRESGMHSCCVHPPDNEGTQHERCAMSEPGTPEREMPKS